MHFRQRWTRACMPRSYVHGMQALLQCFSLQAILQWKTWHCNRSLPSSTVLWWSHLEGSLQQCSTFIHLRTGDGHGPISGYSSKIFSLTQKKYYSGYDYLRGTKTLLRNLVTQTRNSHSLMEHEDSITRWQGPVMCPRPKPDQSIPNRQKYYLKSNLILFSNVCFLCYWIKSVVLGGPLVIAVWRVSKFQMVRHLSHMDRIG